MSYRQLLANLEALPEGERQLAAHTYVFRDEAGQEMCGCVLGKAIPELRALSGFDPRDDTPWMTHMINARVFQKAGTTPEAYGLAIDEAYSAQRANDSFGTWPKNGADQRRARYAHMIEWLRARVAEESEAPQAL